MLVRSNLGTYFGIKGKHLYQITSKQNKSKTKLKYKLTFFDNDTNLIKKQIIHSENSDL